VRFLGGHFFRTTPLENEVEAHLRLGEKGLAVPQLCFGRIERRAVGFQLELVTRFVPGRTLLELLDEGLRSEQPLHRMLFEVGRLIRHMHELGFAHGDLHPGNLLFPEVGGPLVLDLTSGSFESAPLGKGGHADLVRLARYWRKHRGDGPPLRWVLAFLQGYEPRQTKRRGLFWELGGAYECQIALRAWRW
jgi:tRNA A-37 threonylcarbamoyl transferase component Bud32